jgi:lipid-binding SYLF domain-containing protein
MTGSVRGERVEPGFNPIQSSQKLNDLFDRHQKRRHTMKRSMFTASTIWFLAAWLLIGFGAFGAKGAYAATAKEINGSVNAALQRFYKQVKGAYTFAKTAKGLLVLPNVKKAAFIVGGEYGEGALRVGGKSVDYYNLVSGSFGLQIGAEAKDIIIAFMTNEALNSFRKSKGWEAGVDGNIALITIGEGGRVDTTTVKDPIVAFVFDVKGLMADISLKGAKFTKLDMSK